MYLGGTTLPLPKEGRGLWVSEDVIPKRLTKLLFPDVGVFQHASVRAKTNPASDHQPVQGGQQLKRQISGTLNSLNVHFVAT